MNAAGEGTAPGRIGDPLSAREALSARIVEQIRHHGYFVAHLDPQPHQDLIDVRWAAQAASRELGRRMRTYASAIGAQRPQKVTVVVTPIEAEGASDLLRHAHAGRAVAELLDAHRALLRHGPASA
jgi:hypothetical protein